MKDQFCNSSTYETTNDHLCTVSGKFLTVKLEKKLEAELQIDSDQFSTTAPELQRNYWWKNNKDRESKVDESDSFSGRNCTTISPNSAVKTPWLLSSSCSSPKSTCSTSMTPSSDLINAESPVTELLPKLDSKSVEQPMELKREPVMPQLLERPQQASPRGQSQQVMPLLLPRPQQRPSANLQTPGREIGDQPDTKKKPRQMAQRPNKPLPILLPKTHRPGEQLVLMCQVPPPPKRRPGRPRKMTTENAAATQPTLLVPGFRDLRRMGEVDEQQQRQRAVKLKATRQKHRLLEQQRISEYLNSTRTLAPKKPRIDD